MEILSCITTAIIILSIKNVNIDNCYIYSTLLCPNYMIIILVVKIKRLTIVILWLHIYVLFNLFLNTFNFALKNRGNEKKS